jgi:S1-C subfamily serine protease
MVRAAALVIVVACSDSSSKPPPAPMTTPDAKVADATVTTAPGSGAWITLTMSWIGVRLDGLTITDVLADTPAKKAGVVAGDQLVSLYGEPVGSVHDFVDQIRRMPPGATIPLTVLRGGAELKLSITVEPFPEDRR